jgi:DNA-damage-inducible protein D
MRFLDNELKEDAHKAGARNPRDYSDFFESGYKGLYGGETKNNIQARKELQPKEKILDHMGSEELGANIFRATQTYTKLRREDPQSKELANDTHYEVGKKVRKAIEGLGGTMPQSLPL